MPLFGSHMSIAGGYFKAVEAAHAAGCDCVQLFTKNNNQWRAKDLTDDDVRAFQDALARLGISHPLAHDSYLINLASPDDALWQRSVEALRIELERATRLGIPGVVVHPGAFTTSSEAEGLARIVAGLDQIHAALPPQAAQVLLETTAGQGSNLGWRFEHLAQILADVGEPKRLGICFDTCHVFAAGYDLRTAAGYRETMTECDQVLGLGRIRAFHLNDSVKGLGSRVDRHAHIGHGELGLAAFGWLVNDERFAQVPMYLETEKGQEDGEDWDVINLRALRSLVKSRPGKLR